MRVDADSEASLGKIDPSLQRLRVAVAGLGVIGEGAALRLIEEGAFYDMCAAMVRDPKKQRARELADTRIVADARELLAHDHDVIIDALSCGEAGYDLIRVALSQGVSVVTANKQAIAGRLAELHQLAVENGAELAYAASVGGGAPIVETVRRAREEGPIVAITAILNGTVNYILSELAKGEDFWSAVKSAQDAGFAEPDPTADLSGEDARAKISILSYEAFGEEVPLSDIKVEALTEERAKEIADSGKVWKQLSRLIRTPEGGVEARVAYETVDDDPDLKDVAGEGNAAKIITENGRVFTCNGKGAGRIPTVASLFSDLTVIRRGGAKPPREKTV